MNRGDTTREGRRERLGPTVVIGLGNPLMTDDGIGLAALARLKESWSVPAGVHLVDGGTWGMSLLPEVEDANRLLLLDAIDVDARPGQVVVLGREDLPRFLTQKLSPHQVGLRDVLAVAELRGTLPDETVAMGLQPAVIELATRLSPAAEAGLDRLVRRAVEQLHAWGHRPVGNGRGHGRRRPRLRLPGFDRGWKAPYRGDLREAVLETEEPRTREGRACTS